MQPHLHNTIITYNCSAWCMKLTLNTTIHACNSVPMFNTFWRRWWLNHIKTDNHMQQSYHKFQNKTCLSFRTITSLLLSSVLHGTSSKLPLTLEIQITAWNWLLIKNDSNCAVLFDEKYLRCALDTLYNLVKVAKWKSVLWTLWVK